MQMIKKAATELTRSFFNLTDYRLIKSDKYNLLKNVGLIELLNRWVTDDVPCRLQEFVVENHLQSKAQLQQDLWALSVFMNNRNSRGTDGYFVEFGATDGVTLSNTYLLEKSFEWTGILCEPAISYHEVLYQNRTANLDKRCVFSTSGKLIDFHEVKDRELSGIKDFQHIGGWTEARKEFEGYSVESVSLNDLLISNDSPRVINYMSIDTEGSEYEILRNFPFQEWQIDCLSIEHNYSENEVKLDRLLSENGYQRVCESTSRWDAWYIKKTS